jgi:hypothetical protein
MTTFHPGHHELHGVTVLLEARDARTYVGRFDSQDERGVHLLDVGVHHAGGEQSKDEYLKRTLKFGVRADHKHVLVPAGEVVGITRLSDVTADSVKG